MLTKKNSTDVQEKKPAAKAVKKSQPTFLDDGTPTLVTPAKRPLESKTASTRVVINYDVGYHNHLFIRGKGANLSWHKGIQLKNTSSDEWVWETELPFSNLEFKVLINDEHFEDGDNHQLKPGHTTRYTPRFI